MSKRSFEEIFSESMKVLNSCKDSAVTAYLFGKALKICHKAGLKKDADKIFNSLMDKAQGAVDAALCEEYLKEAIVSVCTPRELSRVAAFINKQKNEYSRIFMLMDIGVKQAELGLMEKARSTADKIFESMAEINVSNASGMTVEVLCRVDPVRSVQLCNEIDDDFVRARQLIEILVHLEPDPAYLMLVRDILKKVLEFKHENVNSECIVFSRLAMSLAGLGLFEEAFDIVCDRIPYVEDSVDTLLYILEFFDESDAFVLEVMEYILEILEDVVDRTSKGMQYIDLAERVINFDKIQAVNLAQLGAGLIKDENEIDLFIRGVEKASSVLVRGGSIIKGLHLLDSILLRIKQEERMHRNEHAKKILPVAKIYFISGNVDKALSLFDDFTGTPSYKRLISFICKEYVKKGDYGSAYEKSTLVEDGNARAEILLDIASAQIEHKPVKMKKSKFMNLLRLKD